MALQLSLDRHGNIAMSITALLGIISMAGVGYMKYNSLATDAEVDAKIAARAEEVDKRFDSIETNILIPLILDMKAQLCMDPLISFYNSN